MTHAERQTFEDKGILPAINMTSVNCCSCKYFSITLKLFSACFDTRKFSSCDAEILDTMLEILCSLADPSLFENRNSSSTLFDPAPVWLILDIFVENDFNYFYTNTFDFLKALISWNFFNFHAIDAFLCTQA